MAGAALPALRRWVPTGARLLSSHYSDAAVAAAPGVTRCSRGTRACGSSCTGTAGTDIFDIDSDSTGCSAPSSVRVGPVTTYEGSGNDFALLEELTVCRNGFDRSYFVKKNLKAEDFKKKFTVGELLGAGATAKVYRAVNQRTGQAVAMKVIHKNDVTNKMLLQSEIQIHKATDHPNILRLLETFEDDNRLFLVTELCDGGDLMGHLAANDDEYSIMQMPEEAAMMLFRQVANSVRYLHSKGIVHRDLKPGNFLFRDRPDKEMHSVVVKMTDFGVSAYCRGRHLLTKTVGTERFMAPEVIRNQPYNEKADIFSLGCILHMLLTGHPPKKKDDGTYVMSKVRLQYVSSPVRELLQQLMQHRPEDRPSAEEIARLPLLQNLRIRLLAKTVRLDAQLFDQMHAYASFPLLKKAALAAMVSRTEHDADFKASIEKFISLDKRLSSALTVDDIHEALGQEVLSGMEHQVWKTLKNFGSDTWASAHGARVSGGVGPTRVGPTRWHAQRIRRWARVHFHEEIRTTLEQLVKKIDLVGSGSINYTEWLAATVQPSWYTDPVRIDRAFRLFDFDGDGRISASDLKKVIPDVFHNLTADAVLQESQLSTKLCSDQSCWITKEHFSMLICTESASIFTLQRLACGVQDPLVACDEPSAPLGESELSAS